MLAVRLSVILLLIVVRRLPELRFGECGAARACDRKRNSEQPSRDGVATHVIRIRSFGCRFLITRQVGVEGSRDGGNVLEDVEGDEPSRKSHHA